MGVMRGKKSPLREHVLKLTPAQRDWICGQMRWELLRRNEGYGEDYAAFAASNPQCCVPSSESGQQEKGKRQEGKSSRVEIFDGTILIPEATAFANKWGCFPRDPDTGQTRFPHIHQNPGMVLPQFDERSRSLTIRFPLDMSTEIILEQVQYWVSCYRKSYPARVMKMRLEDVMRALAVYDLKKKGRSYEEISDELRLDDAGKGSGPNRAKDLFKTARTWIKRAEDPRIWMRTPTIMLRLQQGTIGLQALSQAQEVLPEATKTGPKARGSSTRHSKSKGESTG
jgi:hypothetical protein